MVLAAVIWLVPNAQVWAAEPETTTEYSDEPIVYTSGGGSVTPSTYYRDKHTNIEPITRSGDHFSGV